MHSQRKQTASRSNFKQAALALGLSAGLGLTLASPSILGRNRPIPSSSRASRHESTTHSATILRGQPPPKMSESSSPVLSEPSPSGRMVRDQSRETAASPISVKSHDKESQHPGNAWKDMTSTFTERNEPTSRVQSLALKAPLKPSMVVVLEEFANKKNKKGSDYFVMKQWLNAYRTHEALVLRVHQNILGKAIYFRQPNFTYARISNTLFFREFICLFPFLLYQVLQLAVAFPRGILAFHPMVVFQECYKKLQVCDNMTVVEYGKERLHVTRIPDSNPGYNIISQKLLDLPPQNYKKAILENLKDIRDKGGIRDDFVLVRFYADLSNGQSFVISDKPSVSSSKVNSESESSGDKKVKQKNWFMVPGQKGLRSDTDVSIVFATAIFAAPSTRDKLFALQKARIERINRQGLMDPPPKYMGEGWRMLSKSEKATERQVFAISDFSLWMEEDATFIAKNLVINQKVVEEAYECRLDHDRTRFHFLPRGVESQSYSKDLMDGAKEFNKLEAAYIAENKPRTEDTRTNSTYGFEDGSSDEDDDE